MAIREGSAPNFAPPVQEGTVYEFEDEAGEVERLEFLGLILRDEGNYGVFFPVDDDHPACSSGEVVILQVLDVDEEGQPSEFELVLDEAVAADVFADFKIAAKDLYDFE